MRTIFLAALFTCTLLTPAHAQEPRLSSMQLQDYVGQYDLVDGRVLNVIQRERALVAQLEGQDPVRLKPTGPASFVARTGNLSVTFDQRSNGNVAGVTVTTRLMTEQQAQR